MLGKLLRDRVYMGFPEHADAIFNRTELQCESTHTISSRWYLCALESTFVLLSELRSCVNDVVAILGSYP